MGVHTTKDLGAVFERLIPQAARVAYLLTGDPALAERLAVKSFESSFGTWQDLREGDALETTVLKGVLERARRRSILHRARSTRIEGDDLRRRFIGLRFRQRAALVLVLGERMDEELAADLLQCSTKTLTSAVSSALAGVAVDSGSLEPELMRVAMECWAKDLRVRAGFSHRIVRGIRLRRFVTSFAVIIAVPLIGLGAYTAAKGLVAVSRAHDVSDRSGLSSAVAEGSGDVSKQTAQRYAAKFTAACPAPRLALSFNDSAVRDAESVALEFNEALVVGESRAVDRLAAPGDISDWGHTQSSTGMVVAGSERARSDGRVIMNCGPRVAARSWKVVVHDSNGVTAEGLATFYLVRLKEGWKVWGSYDGGW